MKQLQNKFLLYTTILIFAYLQVLCPTLLAQSTLPKSANVISSIQVLPNNEDIAIAFKNNLTIEPSYLFEPGHLQTIFPSTNFPPTLTTIKINGKYIKSIFLQKEGKNTILNIYFQNKDINPIGKVNHSIKQTQLTFHFQISPTTISEAKEQHFLDQVWSPTSEPKKEHYTTSYVVAKMLLALLFTLALIYILLYIYKRFFLQKIKPNFKKHNIQISSSYSLGGKQKIAVVEINNTAFACGITPQNISLIAPIKQPIFSSFMEQTNETTSIETLRQAYQTFKENKKNKNTNKNKSTHFTTDFLKQLKNLSPFE